MSDSLDARSTPTLRRGQTIKGGSGSSPFLKALILLLVVAILIVGYQLVRFAFFSDDRPPRSEVERRLFQSREAIKANPRSASPHASLAIALSDMGDYKGANEELAVAKKLEPTFFRAWYLTALNYQKTGDLKSAETELLAAEKIVRKRVTQGGSWEPLHFRLGEIYIQMTQWDKAIKQLNIALEMTPEGADTLVLLGRAYEGKGDKDKALDSYERAFAFDPANEEAKTALKRLNK